MISFFLTLRRLWRGIQRSANDPEFRALLVVFIVLLASGTLFYWSAEGWSTLDALYFSVVAITTVGFGDLAPQTSIGKIFTVIYLLVGIGVTVSLVAKIAAAQISNASSLHVGRQTAQPVLDDGKATSERTER